MDEPSPITDHSVSEDITESLTQLTIQHGNGSEKLQVTLDHDHEDSSPGQGAQAASNACSDDMTDQSTPDAREVSRLRREDQGDLECEVWAEGSEGTREWEECTKYPGHEQFIPVSKFSLKHLPKEYRKQEYLDGILAISRMTVRVRSRYISEARPDGYPFSNHRGERFTITGSGLVQKRICGPDVVNSEVHLASAEHGREDQYECSASAALTFASDAMGAKLKSTEFCPEHHKKCKSMIAKLLYGGRSHSDDYSDDDDDLSAFLLGLEDDTEGDTELNRWLLTYDFQCDDSIKHFLINEFADDPAVFDPDLLNHDDYVRQFCLCNDTGNDEFFNIFESDDSDVDKEVGDVKITEEDDGWKDEKDKSGRGNGKKKGRRREEDAYSNYEQVEKTNDNWEKGEKNEGDKEDGKEEDGGEEDESEEEEEDEEVEEEEEGEEGEETDKEDEEEEEKEEEEEEGGDEDGGLDNETFGYVHPCSCPDCTEYDSPKPTGYYLNVMTARHVVFDCKEAQNTVVDLFYDQDGQGIKKQLHGVDMQLSHPAGDWAILKCVTHDYSLVCELRKLMSNMTKRVECMKEKWIDYPLAIICSHPHGLPKHITVGKWTNRNYYYDNDISYEDIIQKDDKTFLSGMWTNYVYDTPTCQGSSGAAVLILGYKPGTMFVKSTFHPHFGVHSLEQGLNKSGTFVSLFTADPHVMNLSELSANARMDIFVTCTKGVINSFKRIQIEHQRLVLEQIKKDTMERKSGGVSD